MGFQTDTWLGVVAGIACGGFTGALRLGGVNPGTIAGAIASCALMFIDAAIDSG